MADLITLDTFLAQATGLTIAQKDALGQLNVLGAKTYARWMSIARELSTNSLGTVPVVLGDIADQLGLNPGAVAVLTARFGTAPRAPQVWIALAEQFLDNPQVWTGACSTPPVITTPATTTGGINLNGIPGTGYLHRDVNFNYVFESIEIPAVPVTPTMPVTVEVVKNPFTNDQSLTLTQVSNGTYYGVGGVVHAFDADGKALPFVRLGYVELNQMVTF